jgi:hypothetical protein
MKFKTHIPEKHLNSIVKYYWTLDGELSSTEMYIHRTKSGKPTARIHYH